MMKRYQFLRYPGGKPKALTLSYDDGIPDDIRLSEILTPYGIKTTFNLNCRALRAQFNPTAALTPDDVREYILSRGHEVALHGEWHRALGTLRPVEGIREVLFCRLELEREYGRIIRGFAYPDTGIRRFTANAEYDDVRRYLQDLGVAYARTLGGDNDSFLLPRDFYAWMPTAHHANPALFDYCDKFLSHSPNEVSYTANRYPTLFYLWGHSYEFERGKNWELIERFADKMAGKDDIYYATNIEICDYVAAYHSLIYSADGTRVYNPTDKTVWFLRDSTLYEVGAGQTSALEE